MAGSTNERVITNINRPCDHKLHLELNYQKEGKVIIPAWGLVVIGEA